MQLENEIYVKFGYGRKFPLKTLTTSSDHLIVSHLNMLINCANFLPLSLVGRNLTLKCVSCFSVTVGSSISTSKFMSCK